MIARPHLVSELHALLERSRIGCLIGPRQVGKSTLARQLLPADSTHYFDLEDPNDLMRLAQPMTALRPLKGLVVIDEVQLRPDLFPILRVLADRPELPAKFLVLGSAAPRLLRQASESLAGRIEILEMGGFDTAEAPADQSGRLWFRGGFPRSFLADTDEDSLRWRDAFVATLLERDLAMMGLEVNAPAMRRFWTMLAHYHGQSWNASEAALALQTSRATANRYLDILEGLLLVRVLKPFHANLLKRQVKSPKIYFRDTGLLHAMLDLHTEKQLLTHPRQGASWEGFVLEEVLRACNPREAYFWGTHNEAELDLLMVFGDRRIGVEIKRTDGVAVTKSMRIAMKDLGLEKLFVIHPGIKRYPLDEGMEAIPMGIIHAWAAELRAR